MRNEIHEANETTCYGRTVQHMTNKLALLSFISIAVLGRIGGYGTRSRLARGLELDWGVNSQNKAYQDVRHQTTEDKNTRQKHTFVVPCTPIRSDLN
jgi:hypothetical protein